MLKRNASGVYWHLDGVKMVPNYPGMTTAIIFLAGDEFYQNMGRWIPDAIHAQMVSEYHYGISAWLEYYDPKTMERIG